MRTNVGVEGGFTANHALSVGMLYENGSTQVTGDRELGLRSVGPQGQCGGNAGATASLRERVEVTFYELAGPYLTLEPYSRVQANANLGSTPTWSVRLGLQGTEGVALDIVGLWRRELPLFDMGNREWVVAGGQ